MLHVDRDAEATGPTTGSTTPTPTTKAAAMRPSTEASGSTVTAPPTRSTGDRIMRKVLRLPDDGPAGTADDARKAFQTSIMVAAVRCVLMYLVFPFVLPAIGVAKGVGPAIGLVINAVAITCIYFSMRRFWRADHPKRWSYGVLGGTVVCFLVYLAVDDIITLAS